MAFTTSTEIIGIDAFAETLDLIVSNVLYKVKEQQATAELPLHVDKEWIMRHLREQVSEEGYTIEPKIINTPNGLGPFFSALPQELRIIIFADCLASGYPQFMASSRAMRKEGLVQISEKGVFRMNVGIMVRMNLGQGMMTRPWECPQPSQEIVNNIQHLSVRVKATASSCRDFWLNIDLEILKQFAGSEIPRKSCMILFDLKSGSNYVGNKLFAVLKTFVGFEDVKVRTTEKNHRSDQLNIAYAMFENLLSPGLGLGFVGQDEEGFFMRFNPRGA